MPSCSVMGSSDTSLASECDPPTFVWSDAIQRQLSTHYNSVCILCRSPSIISTHYTAQYSRYVSTHHPVDIYTVHIRPQQTSTISESEVRRIVDIPLCPRPAPVPRSDIAGIDYFYKTQRPLVWVGVVGCKVDVIGFMAINDREYYDMNFSSL